uniref:EOG090X0FYD n=1 Tax=Evadne anonyx TaxID=141404 RepID=A0A9N6WTH5_9CRUS|nr:EOG090X0FYD [Evadne anonyx]
MGDVEHGVENTPSRVCFTVEELTSFSNEEFVQHWTKQDQYVNYIELQLSTAQSVPSAQVRELEEKLRQSLSESARRESILLMRLNSKEQEMQDLIVQIQELKASQGANSVSLRSSLLDPAVNLLIQQLRKELEKAKSALEETQNELSAWKFTPDSNTGKRLMAKCRLLYQENEELGRMISSGRLAKLEGDLALQRNFSEEMKKSQSELDEFLLELDEDVEGMQSTIYFLQQQLRQTREQLAAVQKENEVFRNSSSSSSSSLTQCQLAGEHSTEHNTPERSEPYMQTNGMLDHTIHQNEFSSSPEQLDPDTAAPAPESDMKQPSKRNHNTVTSHQSSGYLQLLFIIVVIFIIIYSY